MPPNHNLLYQDVLLVECLEAIRTLPAHLYTQQISQVIAKIEDHLSLAIPVTTFNRFAKKYYSPFNRKKFNKISRVVNVSTQEYPKSKFKVHRPCRPQDIQPDVLKYICKIIHGKNRNNNKDLINFGLTCKNWCKAALKQLYYSPNFDSVEKLSNLSVSISYIDVKPRYVNYIQELHLPRVPDSKNTILYRKHVESIAAGGNIVCLTAPSIKIDFLNRILFYCPNIERLSVDSVVLLDEESDNAVEIQMLAQQCECLMDVRFEFVESPKFSYEDSIDGATDNSQTQNEEYSALNGNYINNNLNINKNKSVNKNKNFRNVHVNKNNNKNNNINNNMNINKNKNMNVDKSELSNSNNNNDIDISNNDSNNDNGNNNINENSDNDNNNDNSNNKRWSSIDNYKNMSKSTIEKLNSIVGNNTDLNMNMNTNTNTNTNNKKRWSSSIIPSFSLSSSNSNQSSVLSSSSSNTKNISFLPKIKSSINNITTKNFSTSGSFNQKASSIPIPVGNSSFLSTSPPSKGFGGSNRFNTANNRKSFEGSNVFMDRPASALSISNRPNTNLLSGSIEFPSGGVSGIASFFERPSSALSNASNTTSNSISDLKRIVQMEDVVLNGLGRKLELLTKRHLSLSAINGIIKHCPQLKRVRLIDPMDCLTALPKFENLTSIDITTSRKSHIKQFSHIFNSRTFTRLEHIKLEYEPPVNRPIQRLDQLLFHFSMSAILSHCPRLKSLIHPIYPSTQDEFLNLLKTMRSLPDLRALSLRNYVNDRLLTTVSQKFPSLEALDISNTCYVSGYGIVDVVVNCVNLKYFGIYGIPICNDDINEIQRRLPKCHIFSQFDPKWIWGENKYYLWDTVIYKDDEWKKNDHYEEELLEEEEIKEEEIEEIKEEKEEEIVGASSEVSSSGQISEVSESVHEQDNSIPENEIEPDATPTTPTIVVTEEMEHQGININDDVDEEPEIVTDDEEVKVNEVIEEEEAVKEKPEIQELVIEDNDETIKGSTLCNKNDISEEQVFEPEGDNNSLDEDYINEEYSQNQTFYDHQEEIIHDSSVDIINIDDDNDNEQVSSPQDEDLQIRKDINDLLENTIFMEDEKPLDIKDSKNSSTSNDNIYSVEE